MEASDVNNCPYQADGEEEGEERADRLVPGH